MDRYPELARSQADQLIRPYLFGELVGGTATVIAAMALLATAWLVFRFGHAARIPALALAGAVSAFPLMYVVVGLSRLSNRTVTASAATDPFGLAPAGDVLDEPYGAVADATAWLGWADTVAAVVGLTLAGLVVVALGSIGGRRPGRPATLPLPTAVAIGALFALVGLFAIIAAGTVRRLSTAYGETGIWVRRRRTNWSSRSAEPPLSSARRALPARWRSRAWPFRSAVAWLAQTSSPASCAASPERPSWSGCSSERPTTASPDEPCRG